MLLVVTEATHYLILVKNKNKPFYNSNSEDNNM